MRRVVKFSARWCGPCKMYAPTFQRVAEDRTDLDFISIDIDDDPEAKVRHGVLSVPTTIILDGEEELNRIVGAQSTVRLTKFVDDTLSSRM